MVIVTKKQVSHSLSFFSLRPGSDAGWAMSILSCQLKLKVAFVIFYSFNKFASVPCRIVFWVFSNDEFS